MRTRRSRGGWMTEVCAPMPPTDEQTRAAVLALKDNGHGLRAIASSLGIGRNTVRRILRGGSTVRPRAERAETLSEHDARVRELFASCKGQRQRVHEELMREGIVVPYSTLTGY